MNQRLRSVVGWTMCIATIFGPLGFMLWLTGMPVGDIVLLFGVSVLMAVYAIAVLNLVFRWVERGRR